MTVRTTLTSIATVAGIALGICAPSFADETISLDAYDMTRVEDVDRLQKDIVQTATAECKAAYATWVHGRRHLHLEQCVEEAVDNAIIQANNWSLSQLHASIHADARYNADRGPASSQSASAK